MKTISSCSAKSRLTLILLLAIAGLIPCAGVASGEERPPNILFIICDDLNDSVEGFGGHPDARTPEMDRLARNGVTFTNAQCNVPICGPSRASLWSGLYPHTTGYYGYQQQKNHWRRNPTLRDAVTLQEHFANNGYLVFGTGKIHHNGHADQSVFDNADGKRRFGVWPEFGPFPWNGEKKDLPWGSGHPSLPDEMRTPWSHSFGPIVDISEQFGGKGQWIKYGGEPFKVLPDGTRDRMRDELSADYVIEEILSKEHDKPWIATVGLNRPHSPCYVPPEYFDLFPLETISRAPFLENDLNDVPEVVRSAGNTARRKYEKLMKAGGEELLLRWTQAYLASVAFVDAQIGAILNALEKSPYAGNTLVIVTSDHGYHMGEKESHFKNTTWEESMRVPFLAAGPGVARGQECDLPISLIDVYPTLVDYAGLPREPNRNGNGKRLEGHSLRPLFEHPDAEEWDGPAIALSAVNAQQVAPNEPASVEQQHYSARSRQYRYIRYADGGEELYDHAQDLHEWYNLAANPKYQQVREDLSRQIDQLLATAQR